MRTFLRLAFLLSSVSIAHAGHAGTRGAVYTSTNAPDKNELVVFARADNGQLTAAGTIATGGTGTGVGLGSQGAIARSGRWLFVVNAGSNDISTFELGDGAPRLVARTPSGGTTPISITVHERLAYVLNAGDTGNIAGFWIDDDGALHELAGSTRPLSSSAANPAEVAFSPDGDTLIVSEKDTNVLDAYAIDFFGRAHGPFVHPSNGAVPFGFDFTPDGTLVVSEAAASASSSYRIRHDVDLVSITASVLDGQAAACWLTVSPDGEHAFTANAGTGNLSAFRIGTRGTLSLVGDGIAGVTGAGSHPVDLAFAGDDYLYVLETGTNPTIGGFAVDGARLASLPNAGVLPASAAGLVAR